MGCFDRVGLCEVCIRSATRLGKGGGFSLFFVFGLLVCIAFPPLPLLAVDERSYHGGRSSRSACQAGAPRKAECFSCGKLQPSADPVVDVSLVGPCFGPF